MFLDVRQLGLMAYQEALDLQLELLGQRQRDEMPDTLLLLEHPPVLTMGRRAEEANILLNQEELRAGGVAVEQVSRGGDVTYHGPGQLVGYPIVKLSDLGLGIRDYMTRLEQVIIEVLEGQYGLAAGRDSINRGVWIGPNKICAVGVAVKRAVTMHGFALNVNTNLEHFKWIVPCGIAGRGVTSLQRELGAVQDMSALKRAVADSFRKVFGYES
jgi:lipoyl(octanoyl) transferase